MQCPECGSDLIRRSSRRKLLDWAASLLGLRPFRCEVCRRRFYHFPGMAVERHRGGGPAAAAPVQREKKRSSRRRGWPAFLAGWRPNNSNSLIRRAVVLGVLAVALAVFLAIITHEWGPGMAP